MNATRAATIRGRAWVGGVVSLGRVQTPTLALIVKREREIQAFVPEPYWLVHAPLRPALRGPAGSRATRRGCKDGERADDDRGEGRRQGRASSSRSSARSSPSAPPLLYDLTSLQRDANRRFGFSARRTLQAAQSLYEGKKAITYPRTTRASSRATSCPQLKPTAATLQPIAEYASAARVRARARPASARPGRQRRQGRRPPRDHPDRRRARRRDVHARRAADLRPRRAPLPRRVPPAGALRSARRSSREVEEERFRTRGKVTLDAGWRGVYGRRGRAAARQDEDDARAASCPARAGPEGPLRRGRERGEGDEAAAALQRGDAALRDGDRRQADRRRGAARGHEGARPRHAGHPRRDDRDADPPRVRRARRARISRPRRRGCR